MEPILEVKSIKKYFSGQKAVENISFSINKGSVFGLLGPNGAGKSTIFKMIMGEQKTDSGEFSVGETVKIAYVDQAHSNINPDKSIWENFADGKVKGKENNLSNLRVFCITKSPRCCACISPTA